MSGYSGSGIADSAFETAVVCIFMLVGFGLVVAMLTVMLMDDGRITERRAKAAEWILNCSASKPIRDCEKLHYYKELAGRQ